MRASWRSVVCVLLCASPSLAETVAIKPNLVPGTRWSFDGSTALTLENKATLDGQTQPFTVKNKQRRVGKAEVVAATDGVPTAIRITFDEASSDNTTVGETPQQVPFPYAGKTITITRGAGGAVTDDFNDQVPPQTMAELHGILEQEIVFLPTHPVSVGEEWSADPGTLSRMFQLAGDDKAGMTLKLLDVKSSNGRDLAHIKVSTAANRRQGDMQMRVILQGEALVDLKTGHAIKSNLTGTMQDHGEQPGPGPGGATVSYAIEGSGTLTTEMAAPLGDVAATPLAAAPVAAAPGASDAANPLGAAAVDPFAGSFSDGKLTIEGTTRDGGYVASLTMADKKFPANAAIKDRSLTGTFDASGHPFSFTATVDGDVMTFVTGGKTYTLKRAAPAAPANPLGQSDATPAIPRMRGYTVVASTDAGKTLSTQKQANDVMTAFKAVFPELANYFDDRPAIGGAFQDTRDRKSGTASFTAHLNGRLVRGLVSCHLGERGAGIVVTYCRADADQAEWAKLTTPPTADGVAPASAAVPPLKPIGFPDNSGSISLAEGWTTQATSAMQTIELKGPADESVTIGFNLSVQTPDSPLVQITRQNAATAIQMGQQPIQSAPILVAPFTGPAEAFTNLIPQLSAIVQSRGLPAIQVDHVKQTESATPMMQGGRAGVLSYGVTRIDPDGTRKHLRAVARAETTPIGDSAWMLYATAAAAPDDRFDRDLPTMLAMINSLGENPQVCGQIARGNADAQQQRFAQQQQAHRDQMASFDAQNKAWERRELQQSRSNADFDEVIRGERTVLDTSTGERGSANLGNVNQIVDQLNEGQPGRYQQIPLRDEMYPVNDR